MKKRAKKKEKEMGMGSLILLLLCVVLIGVLLLRWRESLAAKSPGETPSLPQSSQGSTATPTTQSKKPAPTDLPSPVPTAFTPPRGYTEESYQLVTDMVFAYAYQQENREEIIRQDLDQLKLIDPALGAFWEKLMAVWVSVNTELLPANGALPEGLPEDDSLCIVALGFQLNPDGSMSSELVGRCELALACAEKYPEAMIAVTGGGTAWQNSAATEAGVMADWLVQHGVAAERILVEDKSLTTADNAVFTCAILKERYPQVRSLAIVSSDYHLPLGVLLFQECALLSEYETGALPFSVIASAGYDTEGRVMPDSPALQKSYLWSIADPHYP